MSVAVEGQGAGLHGRLWKTKGSRFVARERLRSTNTLSITTVTMLSIYVIVSSIVLLAFSDQLNDLNEKWLNIINVGLSVLIIRESKLNHSKGDYADFRIENWKEFGDEFSNPVVRIGTRLLVWLSNYWLYIAALFAFPVLAVAFGQDLLTIS